MRNKFMKKFLIIKNQEFNEFINLDMIYFKNLYYEIVYNFLI